MSRAQLAKSISDISALRAKLLERRGARNAIQRVVEQKRSELALAIEEREVAQRSLRVLQAASEALRERMKTRLEAITTKVLRYVFDDPRYEVRIDVTVIGPQDFDVTVINPDGGQDTLPSAFTAS